MLAFSVQQRAVFNELFDPLVQVLIEPGNVGILARAHNWKAFIEALCELVE
ncbi:hypothetical protein KPC83_00320 [Collinsella sp. zg1085]|uniref:hypothetical protein n=1 Tax=Collinsella sp. zg1085 TaxID=2844380 RepID=UPI001C0CDE19|nr:hypothetical protein [Collinsella sp. zg1085]QWT17655.1 hypothetical protein KPC83_00320 [Collinsella sp. zg1085]